MDVEIGWTQPEQEGPAEKTYTKCWHNSRDKSRNNDPLPDYIAVGDSIHNIQHGNKNRRESKPFRNNESNDNANALNKLSSPNGIISRFNLMPWRKPEFRYHTGVVGLHEEIIHFIDYIKLKPLCYRKRQEVVDRTKKIILNLWPQAEVEVFGSMKTNLCLPTSDIDLTVKGKWEVPPLRTLEKALYDSNKYVDFCVLDKASVPIIKVSDAQYRVRVDISFNSTHALEAAEFVLDAKKRYPNLERLTLVLKQFLYMRNLNEVWKGGISSYCLTLMVISFLQLHPREDAVAPNANLGVLLIEFFELYGYLFNYLKVGISVKSCCYVKKEVILKKCGDNHRSILCVEDPTNITNDVGRSSYGALQVQRAFRMAYLDLTKACGPTSSYIDPKSSILGRIIRISAEDDKLHSGNSQHSNSKKSNSRSQNYH